MKIWSFLKLQMSFKGTLHAQGTGQQRYSRSRTFQACFIHKTNHLSNVNRKRHVVFMKSFFRHLCHRRTVSAALHSSTSISRIMPSYPGRIANCNVQFLLCGLVNNTPKLSKQLSLCLGCRESKMIMERLL